MSGDLRDHLLRMAAAWRAGEGPEDDSIRRDERGSCADELEDTIVHVEKIIKTERRQKPPLQCLGEVPRALNALARQIKFGADQPGRAPGCWRPAYSSPEARAELVGKALRHLMDYAAGMVLDEHGRPNLPAVLANVSFLIELEGQKV